MATNRTIYDGEAAGDYSGSFQSSDGKVAIGEP